jgi:hypothetical protein
MKLRFQLLDAKGYLVEQFDETPEDAMERIEKFITLHGTDPDNQGQSASAGSVTFFPLYDSIEDRPEKAADICGKCGEVMDTDCFGSLRCEICDPPCPGCFDGGGPNG